MGWVLIGFHVDGSEHYGWEEQALRITRTLGEKVWVLRPKA